MKKIFLSLSLASALFAASINFNESTATANRVNPAAGNAVLSYHDSIKDAKNQWLIFPPQKLLQEQIVQALWMIF